MNKNIMCVCASRDTTDIGFYDVDVFDGKIDMVKFEGWKETTGLQIKDIADLVSELCHDSDYSMVIIDSRGVGMGIIDALEKDMEFSTPIYKATLNRSNASIGVAKLKGYSQSDKFLIDEDINIDLDKFNYEELIQDGQVVLHVKSCGKEFMNMIQFFAFIEVCILKDKNIKNRATIEKNLREILEILVDDLCDADKSNTKEINDLVRLIDKVNYIRNQY